MNSIKLAQKIKELCKKRGITVKELLEICKIEKGFIYNLEKNNSQPRIDKIEAIANYFKISIDYLTGRTENPEINK